MNLCAKIIKQNSCLGRKHRRPLFFHHRPSDFFLRPSDFPRIPSDFRQRPPNWKNLFFFKKKQHLFQFYLKKRVVYNSLNKGSLKYIKISLLALHILFSWRQADGMLCRSHNDCTWMDRNLRVIFFFYNLLFWRIYFILILILRIKWI